MPKLFIALLCCIFFFSTPLYSMTIPPATPVGLVHPVKSLIRAKTRYNEAGKPTTFIVKITLDHPLLENFSDEPLLEKKGGVGVAAIFMGRVGNFIYKEEKTSLELITLLKSLFEYRAQVGLQATRWKDLILSYELKKLRHLCGEFSARDPKHRKFFLQWKKSLRSF